MVTGGSGFVGTNLIAELESINNLLGKQYDIISTGSHPIKRFDGVKYLGRSLNGIDWSALDDIDVCIHMGANNDTICENREDMFQSNVTASENLFERLEERGCKQFVYASSTAVYGDAPTPFVEDSPKNPLNVYAESKLYFEQSAAKFAESNGANAVGLRFCNIYGRYEGFKGRRASMVTQLYQQVKNGMNPVLFKNGEQVRDYIYVKDAVGAILRAMDYNRTAVFNCAGGQQVSFNEVANLVMEALGVDRQIEYIDNPYEATYQNDTLCDITKLKKVLGYLPIYDIRSGIFDYIGQ